jgi:4-amino-4-deoxy-L-arabinose transferase-like glycosyltransferase
LTRYRSAWRLSLLGLWAAFSLFAIWGAATVPFHPDEATYLYMSRDFDLLFEPGLPATVGWQAPGQPALARRYRLLDAPLGRYLSGLGRALAGQPFPTQDWNWSATWAENQAAGAVPDPRTLAAARLPATILTALSCGFVYALSRQYAGRPTALTATALYALSGLLLLHGRRAMSEGPLLFFTVLTVWLLLRPRPQPVLAALALAAAVASKLTALALLPLAVAALWPNAWDGRAARLRTLAAGFRGLALFGLTLTLALWAFYPALWVSPVTGLQAMGAARAVFLDEQAAMLQSVAPHVFLSQPGLRVLGLLYHTYFAPLAYADVGNYAAALAAAEDRYAAQALNVGWHTDHLPLNFTLGGLLLGLTFIGFVDAGRQIALGLRARGSVERSQRAGTFAPLRAQVLVSVWTLATVLGLLVISVATQRYFVPLLPIACLWAASGLNALARPFQKWRTPAPSPAREV